MKLTRVGAILVLLPVIAAVSPSSGIAADEAVGATADIAHPETLTKPEIRELISRLSDDEARALLIRQLDKAAVAPDDRGDVGFADTLDQALRDLGQRWRLMWASVPEVPGVATFVVAKLTAGRSNSYLWTVLLQMAAIFLGATVVEWLFRHLFRRFGNLFRAEERERIVERLSAALLRTLVELLALGVFVVGAVIVYFAFDIDHTPTRVMIGSVFWGVVFFRLIVALAGLIFSPRSADLRLFPLDDATARWAFGRALMVGALIVIALQFVSLFRRYELPEGPFLALIAVVATLVLGAIIAMIWNDRKTVAQMILPEGREDMSQVAPARTFLAENWHVFASSYILGLWILGVVSRFVTGQGHSGAIVFSLCLLPGVPMVDWLARAAIRRLCNRPHKAGRPPEIENARGPGHAEQAEQADTGEVRRGIDAPSFEPVLIRNMRVILCLVVVVLLAQVWGLDLHDAAAAGTSTRVTDALFEIAIALILGYAVWGFAKTAIGHYAPHEGMDVEKMVEGETGGTGLTRAQTLLPLLRKFILITLIVVLSLVVLSSLGVSIGPLIAGAGVAGLAVGFGAQTLVRDVISGAFFLADDAFRVGEYIDVGVAKGMVERISVRSFRLRHQNGPVNTVPFGEVQKVTNFSRDWALVKLEMRVPSDTDLEELRKIVKRVGQEMMDHPQFGPSFLQPLKSQGVNRMDDDGAFIIRVKFMTRPGEQFIVRREVYRRVQEAFATNGIKFAPKRVMVDTPSGSAHGPAAAAALALEKPKVG